MTNALNVAKEITDISKEDIQIMYHARKSLLLSNEKPWMKREGNIFDITMGAYDGAEVCELVAIFMLNKISEKYNKNDIGIYNDDRLAAFKNISGPESKRRKKNFQSLFKMYVPEIIIKCNKNVVDYLDVTFNLKDRAYEPDNKITYINVQSSHRPNIIKQLQKAIKKRLCNNSSNETMFNEAAPLYEKAVSEAGYDVKSKYYRNKKTKQKNRKRKIIWFNPPHCKNVVTKVGHYFLKLLDKHFPRQHKLHKIFNKNTVKISYSCTKNIKSIITSHNKKVVHQNEPCPNEQKCNCIKKDLCPLNKSCQAENIVYEATITCNKQTYGENIYIGIAEIIFKKRYNNHKRSFNLAAYKNDAKLSKEVWKIKLRNFVPKIKWRILRKCLRFNRSSLRCNICLNKKIEIALFKRNNILTK